MVRGEPWYTAPPFHAESQPQDVSPECLRTLKFPGLGDLKSVICQSRLPDPYSQTPPSTQTPTFLFLHRAIGAIPPTLVFLTTILLVLSLTLCATSKRFQQHRIRVALALAVSSLPMIAALERGNFFYVFAPFFVILLYGLFSDLEPRAAFGRASRGFPEGATVSILVSLKPTMIPLLLFGIRRSVRYFLTVIGVALAIFIGLNGAIGFVLYDIHGYPRAVTLWRNNNPPFPWNFYSVNPSSIRTITTSLNIDKLVPTTFLNLFTLIAPIAIFASLIPKLFFSTGRNSRSRDSRFGSFTSRFAGRLGNLDDVVSLYVASTLTLLASGAMYQTTVPIVLLVLKFTERDTSPHWRWQLGYLVLLLIPSIGVHRAMLPFSPILASAIHTLVVLALLLMPSLLCLRILISHRGVHGFQRH